MPKIEMTAHIVVAADGEWLVYGYSGSMHPAAAPPKLNWEQMVEEGLWTIEPSDRHIEIALTIDIPELPTPAALRFVRL